ncbi:hypothetical protein DW322_11250 [Rhodococcus rhodnii]|uniref:Scaffolding protein n=2 Tax=Rhodococcus rhodnii TaxID=38312 RepID=R7WRZ8_9NOCA|nr:hypothetical protein [Rhodococcus rhodnii]EOM78060.1 hypothetical protein Rrhod_0601 [Rhodococcus rhodnii LMG 5362]TXG90687.1 hypothetical protein DW322_11250 [Rhodococcus rhodnii]
MTDAANTSDSTDTGDDIFGEQDDAHDTDVDSDADTDSELAPDDDGADELGDKGKRALESMKSKWKSERTRRQQLEARVADLESKDGDDDDASRQRAADAAALAKANSRIVRAEIRAAAAGKLSDPADALSFIDLDQFEVGEDGDVDQDEIAEAITDLVRRKPYLAAQSGTGRPKPDRSQGARGKSTATTADRFASAIDNLL